MNGRTFDYEPSVQRIVTREVRRAVPFTATLRKATRAEDFGGTDFQYVVNESCPIAVRVRYNRPPRAADTDITFRVTEPAKMRDRSYAPLAIYLWVNHGEFVAGRLIDVYRLYDQADPPLARRTRHGNDDGTAFLIVTIAELQLAELRRGDREAWIAARLGGNEDLKRILRDYSARLHADAISGRA